MDLATVQSLALAIGAMVVGIVLLIRGGDWTTDAAVYTARHHGIPHLLIGFTVVAFGTSLPELIVSVLANLQGSAGIAMGNVLGSNIANILLVIGSAALFAPLVTKSKAVIKDLLMMMVATGLLAFLMMYGEIGRLAGLAMVLMLISYIYLQYRMAETGEMNKDGLDNPRFSSQRIANGFLLMGLVGVAIGAQFLVYGAKTSAFIIGVPEAVIALSIIAFGTSLPELSTSIIAGRKGHSELVLGNIIGSNVFNILMILGVTALVKPIAQGSFAQQLVEFDIWLVVLVSIIFSFLLLFFNKITKPVGIVFVTAYLIYNIYIYGIYIAQ